MTARSFAGRSALVTTNGSADEVFDRYVVLVAVTDELGLGAADACGVEPELADELFDESGPDGVVTEPLVLVGLGVPDESGDVDGSGELDGSGDVDGPDEAVPTMLPRSRSPIPSQVRVPVPMPLAGPAGDDESVLAAASGVLAVVGSEFGSAEVTVGLSGPAALM
jgi:hypothetical protein